MLMRMLGVWKTINYIKTANVTSTILTLHQRYITPELHNDAHATDINSTGDQILSRNLPRNVY